MPIPDPKSIFFIEMLSVCYKKTPYDETLNFLVMTHPFTAIAIIFVLFKNSLCPNLVSVDSLICKH